MFVLGIDPGLTRCGFGAVRRSGSGRSFEAVAAGVLETDPGDPIPKRLAQLAEELEALFDDLRPEVVVIERVFFQTNVRTAMSVAQASGLALVAAASRDLPIVELTSNEVKLALTGYGAATKAQVQAMVSQRLGLPGPLSPPDAADALALAITYLGTSPLLQAIAASGRK